MKEQERLTDFYIKRCSKTVLEQQGTFKNNPYCYAIMQGLVNKPEECWEVNKDGETLFTPPELKEDFMKVLEMFFSKKYISGEPDMEGTMENGTTDFKLTTGDIAIEAKGKVPFERTLWISSHDTYPLQFLVSGEDIDVDTDGDFKVKDMLWVCLRPGGFVLSLDAEQFGVLVTLLEDVLRRQHQRTFEENVNQMFKPSMQEAIFTAFSSFYKYLKDTDSIKSTYMKL